jgi:hypothetical protein
MSRAAGDALRVGEGTDDDPSGERQLSRGETALWYGLAGVTYVTASLVISKGLLNWFVGPAWLVAFVWIGPALTDRWRAWRAGRR